MAPERTRPRPAATDRGRHNEHDQALAADYSIPPSRRELDALARDSYPPPEPRDPEAELEAICSRLALDGRGRQAFALAAVAHAQPRLGEHVVELVGELIDSRDEIALELMDFAVHIARQERGAADE